MTEPNAPEEKPEMVCIYDPLHELMARFEHVEAASTATDPFEGLTVEDCLKKHIVEGIKKNLEAHLADALQKYTPLEIINEVLLDGMKTVGELFGSGKMQLPFVLQSAEVMKAAVRHLEPMMEKVEGSEKGSILLATVAGDVHDIGKNLVDIILSNNGYRVVNIGIKQSINAILDKTIETKCQVIGLSGLLVKSTLVMRDNLLELNARGLSDYPVILGGAALTRAYVDQDLGAIYDGRVFYAQDAFEGLRLMGDISEGREPQRGVAVKTPELAPDDEIYDPLRVKSHRTDELDRDLYEFTGVKSDVVPVENPPPLPFYGANRHTKFDIYELYKYINPIALFRGQWQFRRPDGMGNADFTKWLDDNAGPIFDRMKRELGSGPQAKSQMGLLPLLKLWYRSYHLPRRPENRMAAVQFTQATGHETTMPL